MNDYVVNELKLNKNTVIDWFMFCRGLYECGCEQRKIGGVNVIVEIDESKFGKMKYGKGKPVDGKWVFWSHAEGMFDHYLAGIYGGTLAITRSATRDIPGFLKAVITLCPPLGKDQQ
ncbi:hypothetical protein TNCV_1641221 [Trichonephila clavipes]|nr:hypothetical protein TNCV_1641221 [Trichonephila clavipes]